MVLDIVKYGNPVLRKPGAEVKSITLEIQQLVADMLETMYAAQGVGLAAQQVGHPLQLCVLDVRNATDRPSWAEQGGQRIDVATLMPLVLINPKVELEGEREIAPEGCLSFPEIYADIARPSIATVIATDLQGKQISFRCGGLLSRAIQHEYDHIRGVLFIDRMTPHAKEQIRPALEELHASTLRGLSRPKAHQKARASTPVTR
ncbi:MAG: peptide deformylase [Verrucomicrobiae bacterium]|nr:peptide deformylase [Verrucomicrobiae bacterium]